MKTQNLIIIKKYHCPLRFQGNSINDSIEEFKQNLSNLVSYCNELKLDVVGLMCIPPINCDPDVYFNEMKLLNKTHNFYQLSMGMSADFQIACKYNSTYLRIGSSIFGNRY